MRKWGFYTIMGSILFISVGFAYLSSQLNIIGNATLSASSWDVHFENLVVTAGSATTPTITGTNNTAVDYVVDLDFPGDFLEFRVDAVNEGSIDTMIKSVTNTGLTETQKKYLEYSVTYANLSNVKEKDSLAHDTTETYIVRVKYRDDITAEDLPKVDEAVSLRFEVEFEQADNSAKAKDFIRVVSQAGENLAVGDELAIENEMFNIVSTDNNNTVLLAKYNLDTTNNVQLKDNNTLIHAFSNRNYWVENDTLLSDYGNAFDSNDIYTKELNSNNGENYSIAYYVENYINQLKLLGATTIEGRILTNQEAIQLGCQESLCTGIDDAKKFIYSTNYWIGTAHSTDTVLTMNTSGSIESKEYSATTGIRPVIVIPTTSIPID